MHISRTHHERSSTNHNNRAPSDQPGRRAGDVYEPRARIDHPVPLERDVQLRNKRTGHWVHAEIRRGSLPNGYCFELDYNGTRGGEINFDVAHAGVHVGLVESYINGTFRGVGSALLETAIRASFNLGFACNVRLEAVHGSHGFYLGQGFTCDEEEETYTDMDLHIAYAEALVENPANPDTRHLGLVFMKLSDEARAEWTEYFAGSRRATERDCRSA